MHCSEWDYALGYGHRPSDAGGAKSLENVLVGVTVLCGCLAKFQSILKDAFLTSCTSDNEKVRR